MPVELDVGIENYQVLLTKYVNKTRKNLHIAIT